jgi:hypothetical protein
MHSRAFLEEYVTQPREKSGLKRYCRHFDRISTVLMARDELDRYSRGRVFFAGLPQAVGREVLSRLDTADMQAGSIDYDAALKAVEKSSE